MTIIYIYICVCESIFWGAGGNVGHERFHFTCFARMWVRSRQRILARVLSRCGHHASILGASNLMQIYG